MQEFHEDLSHSWEYWLSFSWRCWAPLLCVQLTSIPSWFVMLFYFLTVNCYFSGNLLIALASTFVTADFFWTKVQCFMSDFFLSLFLSINAKNHKFPSLSWSVSIVDESLHSICSSCGKLIFFGNSQCAFLFACPCTWPSPLSAWGTDLPGICGRLFIWTVTREIQRESGTFQLLTDQMRFSSLQQDNKFEIHFARQ